MMTDIAETPKARKGARIIFSIILGMFFILFFCLFTGLGILQVQRLGWKTDLIARVNTRIHLPPRPAPPKADWPDVSAQCCEYLPVRITGHFLNDKEILVTALTSQGSGYWLLTPFQSADGAITFINRGFVPMDKKAEAARTAGRISGKTTVTGLLRMGEKNGFYPRGNHPASDIWYTRELPAMADRRQLPDVAPYFIDADKTPNTGGVPVGGLTVIRFPNNHFVYAVTWFALAGGVVLAAIFVIAHSRKKRAQSSGHEIT